MQSIAGDAPTAMQPSSRRPWLRWTLVTICLLLAAMWVYALFFAPKGGVYVVRDAAWRHQAGAICTDANAQRQALTNTAGGFITNPTHEQMLQRATIVDQATDIVAATLDRLVALPLASADDRLRVTTWERYYRQVIADRRAYTAHLRVFEAVPYAETNVHGGPVSNVVLDFATANGIPQCAAPSELSANV